MASAPAEHSTKTRHLRPRESTKRHLFLMDIPGRYANKTSGSNVGTLEEEDDELSTNTTASHYLGMRPAAKRKNDGLITVYNTPKRRRIVHGNGGASTTDDNASGELQDVYCWECHKECVAGALDCVTCPRSFHPGCIAPSAVGGENGVKPTDDWTCPVCVTIMKAECADTRSWAMQQLNIDQFSTILGFALQRMKHPDVKTSEAFHNPVPASLLPDYYDIIFHPMDLSTLDKNIKKKMYASTESFLEDAKWILHNSLIYSGANTKHANDARLLIKICRHEMAEIELCPFCYLNACIRKDSWFTESCAAPHCLVWAKLKGFPYWPAKALRLSSANNVDVRFFGAHDRAWIPLGQVYLLSSECPMPVKNTKKFGLDKAMEELNTHIARLRDKFGEFNYASPKTEFKPEHLYFCSVLFGKNVASSETAQKLLSTSAGRRYRDTSGEVVNEIANRSENSCEQRETDEVEEEQWSDRENGVSGGVQQAEDEVALVVQQEHDDNPIERTDDQKQDTSDSANADEQRDRSPAIWNTAQSPDSTSPQAGGSAVVATVAECDVQVLHENMEGKPEDTPVNGKDGSGKNAISKCEEPAGKKRNLQSILEKMRSNMRQFRDGSSSPISSTASQSTNCKQPMQMRDETDGPSEMHVQHETSPTLGQNAAVCDKYLEKITRFVHSTVSDMLSELNWNERSAGASEDPKESQTQAELVALRTECAKMRSSYCDAVRAMKHTAKLSFLELQQVMEAEKAKALEELKCKLEEEKRRAVAEAKTKQWCANCGKEAVFYCCWNTSYCDYPCQQQHWPKHQATCAQIRQATTDNAHQISRANAVIGGNRVSMGQLPLSGSSSSAPTNVVSVYTSTVQNAGLFRTNGGQPAAVARQIAAVVRKS